MESNVVAEKIAAATKLYGEDWYKKEGGAQLMKSILGTSEPKKTAAVNEKIAAANKLYGEGWEEREGGSDLMKAIAGGEAPASEKTAAEQEKDVDAQIDDFVEKIAAANQLYGEGWMQKEGGDAMMSQLLAGIAGGAGGAGLGALLSSGASSKARLIASLIGAGILGTTSALGQRANIAKSDKTPEKDKGISSIVIPTVLGGGAGALLGNTPREKLMSALTGAGIMGGTSSIFQGSNLLRDQAIDKAGSLTKEAQEDALAEKIAAATKLYGEGWVKKEGGPELMETITGGAISKYASLSKEAQEELFWEKVAARVNAKLMDASGGDTEKVASAWNMINQVTNKKPWLTGLDAKRNQMTEKVAAATKLFGEGWAVKEGSSDLLTVLLAGVPGIVGKKQKEKGVSAGNTALVTGLSGAGLGAAQGAMQPFMGGTRGRLLSALIAAGLVGGASIGAGGIGRAMANDPKQASDSAEITFNSKNEKLNAALLGLLE